MEAGEVTWGKLPDRGKLGWLQGQGEDVVWGSVGKKNGEGTGARQHPQPSRELALGLQGSLPQCCPLPGHDLFNCSCV